MKRKAAKVVPELLERGVTGSREGVMGMAQSHAGAALEKIASLEANLPNQEQKSRSNPSWKLWKGPSRELLEPRWK